MLQASVAHAEARRLLSAAALRAALPAWAAVAPEAIDATWASPARRLLAAMALLQERATVEASDYVAAALAEQNADVAPIARVATSRLAGVASDGRPLASLLDQPAIRTKRLLADGMDPIDALAAGRRNLQMLTVTQVQDAGRTAEGLAIVARPDVNWTRRLRGDSCSRCTVLADKTFRWNTGFARHPGCDCYHEPTARPAPIRPQPGQGLQVAGRSSRDGRVMPEQVLAETDDRARAVQALERLGYLQT